MASYDYIPKPELSIFDFDGTFTDSDKQAEVYREIMYTQVAKDFSLDEYLVREEVEKAICLVKAHPSEHLMMYNGYKVADASADPFLCTGEAINIFLRTLGRQFPNGMNESSYSTFLHFLAHKQLPQAFKEDAEEVIYRLQEKGALVIVSSSQKESILAKLSSLVLNHRIQVYGNAGKIEVDETMLELPFDRRFKGFPFPVILRRRYKRTLDKVISDNSHANLALVAGDLFDFDLSVPNEMNIRTILVASASTPQYARDVYDSNELNGKVVNTLSEILEDI